MRSMKNYLYLLIILLCACKKPLKVTVISDVSAGPNTIIFDERDTLVTNKPIDTILLSPFKKHVFTVNNSKPQDFFLRDTEGILNLAKKDFVVVAIKYENEGGTEYRFPGSFTMDSYVLIDSFIVCDKAFKVNLKTTLKAIVDSAKVRKNGNYYPLLDQKFSPDREVYDGTEEVNGFKKIGNNTLFIKKFWDYNLGDSIPEEIKVKVRKSDLKYKESLKKTFITFAEDFLFMAKMSKKTYAVVDVRDLLKGKDENNKKLR